MTVSRALNSPQLVRPRTVEKVMQAVRATGYIPNALAGGLASRRSKLIAVVVPQINNNMFVDTIQALSDTLAARGYLVDELHGDLLQVQRALVLKRFRKAELQILCATDIAARGLDIEGVTHVFNYDIPHDAEGYIHRIGRTGRAGQEGKAVTFVNARQYELLRRIEAGIKSRIKNENSERHQQHKEKQEKILKDIRAKEQAKKGGKAKAAGKSSSKFTKTKGKGPVHKGRNDRSHRAGSHNRSNATHRSKMGKH